MQSAVKSYCFKWSATVGITAVVTYLLMEQFYAMWWIFFVVPVFALILLLIASFFAGVIFWVIRRDEFQYAYLPLLVNVAVVLIIISQPGITRNKRYHQNTANLCDQKGSNVECGTKLFLDYYSVFGGGATTTDIVAVYLTDFKNFRVFLGTYSVGDGWIKVKVAGDQVCIENTEKTEVAAEAGIPKADIDSANTWNIKYKMKNERKTYSLLKLRRQRIFE